MAAFARSSLLRFPEHILADDVKPTHTHIHTHMERKHVCPVCTLGVRVPVPIPAFVTVSDTAGGFPGGSGQDGMWLSAPGGLHKGVCRGWGWVSLVCTSAGHSPPAHLRVTCGIAGVMLPAVLSKGKAGRGGRNTVVWWVQPGCQGGCTASLTPFHTQRAASPILSGRRMESPSSHTAGA